MNQKMQQADSFAGSVGVAIYSIGIKKSYSEIARRLNEQGVRTRTGGAFYAQTVKNMLLRIKTEFFGTAI